MKKSKKKQQRINKKTYIIKRFKIKEHKIQQIKHIFKI